MIGFALYALCMKFEAIAVVKRFKASINALRVKTVVWRESREMVDVRALGSLCQALPACRLFLR
jgi:hypothetical protein